MSKQSHKALKRAKAGTPKQTRFAGIRLGSLEQLGNGKQKVRLELAIMHLEHSYGCYARAAKLFLLKVPSALTD